MTGPTWRDVSLLEYLGGFEATLREKIFCSDCWQEVCCREIGTPAGLMVRVDLGAYPPGGRDCTAMRRCGVCGKWAPPDGEPGACIDCRADVDEEAFVELLRQIHANGEDELVRSLVRLRWKRPYVRPRDADGGNDRPDASALLPDHLGERQEDSLPESLTFFEQQTTSGRHWLAEALDIPDRPMQRRSAVGISRTVHRHLAWVGRDTPRRAIGCSVILLPEDEDALIREVAYYEATGHLIGRATRQDTVNPRRGYRRGLKRRRRN